MKIREKLCKPFDGLKTQTANELEEIADDYLSEFSEWLSNSYHNLNWYVRNKKTKELIETFKLEKGL